MTRRTLHTLAAIVVGLVLMLIVLRGNDISESGPMGDELLPGFKAVANSISEIRVAQPAGNEGVTLKLEDGKWVVSARDNYPADVGQLRKLVIALADARILEEKTSNPEQYERLRVNDPEDNGKGSKIILTAPNAAYEVILGDTAQGSYRYARLAGQATSYLIDQNPELPDTVGDWLLPGVIDIGVASVRRVTITHADGETIVIGKSEKEQTDFDVSEIPEGRELSYATVGNGVAGALGKLELQDVRAAVDGDAAVTARYETWNGLTVTAKAIAEDDEHWIAFRAEAGKEETDTVEQAANINARVSGWQYQLPDYKKNLLTRRWSDLLKDVDN